MARRSQPDHDSTRDTIAAVGLFGFILVPITAVATTLYQKRHPGVVIIESEESGLDPAIRTVMILGFVSVTLLFIAFTIISDKLYSAEAEIESNLKALDEMKGGE